MGGKFFPLRRAGQLPAFISYYTEIQKLTDAGELTKEKLVELRRGTEQLSRRLREVPEGIDDE